MGRGLGPVWISAIGRKQAVRSQASNPQERTTAPNARFRKSHPIRIRFNRNVCPRFLLFPMNSPAIPLIKRSCASTFSHRSRRQTVEVPRLRAHAPPAFRVDLATNRCASIRTAAVRKVPSAARFIRGSIPASRPSGSVKPSPPDWPAKRSYNSQNAKFCPSI
jgi:hypothetical protein